MGSISIGIEKLIESVISMRNIRKWLSTVLILALCISLAGCIDIGSYLPSTQESTESGLTTYRVTVRTHSGQHLKDVGIRVFADADKTELVWYDKTDAQGQMSFIADTFDGYVLALENIPEGYVAADFYPVTGVDNEIILSIGLQSGVNLNTVKLKLGSPMVDMDVTAADGSRHTISKLLASKKAVVLYFFDSGSTDALPALEEAWNACKDEVAVLALNPVDSDVSAFAQGRTVPVAGCDSGWISALDLKKFPAMVIVDRYGIISLLHNGPVGDAGVFRDVFAFFARNDYTCEPVTNIESIVGKELQGTLANPYISDGTTDITASVAPGGMIYYKVYNVDDMLLKIYSANAWVIYEGREIYPENGVITLQLQTPDAETPITLGIGNNGSNTELFVARLSYQTGTENNPHTVDLGMFTAQLEEGSENGLYYMYKAVKPGILRFTCTALTSDVQWRYTVTNRSTGDVLDSETDVLADELTGETYMLLNVNANDVVLLHVATKPVTVTTPELAEIYPAGSFQFRFLYEGSQGDDPVLPPEPGKELTYNVTIVDSYGIPLPGVTVIFSDSTGVTTAATDENGLATYRNSLGSASVTIQPPQGYTIPKAEFTLREGTNDITLCCTGKMEGTPIAISGGNAYTVGLGSNYAIMQADVLNYFLFTPDKAGVYDFAAPALLGYWGTDTASLTDLLQETAATAQGFTLTVTEENVGKAHIISMTGAPYATLSVSWAELPAVPDPVPSGPADTTDSPDTTDTPIVP